MRRPGADQNESMALTSARQVTGADDPVDGNWRAPAGSCAPRLAVLGPKIPSTARARAPGAPDWSRKTGNSSLESAYRVRRCCHGPGVMTRAPQVCGPTIPSTCNWSAIWKLLHRRLGLRPEDPVHGPRGGPRSRSRLLEGRERGCPWLPCFTNWPRLDLVAHRVLLWVGPRPRHGRGKPLAGPVKIVVEAVGLRVKARTLRSARAATGRGHRAGCWRSCG